MVFSQIVMRSIPLLGCVFLSNLGCKISNIVRVICVYTAAAGPVLFPWLQPYFETGRVSALEISVQAVTTIGASVFAGCTASYAAIKARTFGIRVQGFTWGFMLSAATGVVYAAHLRREYPMVVPLLAWIIFGTSLIQGYLIGVASITHEFRVNQIFTSLAGAIFGLMVVASMGFGFSDGLSIGAIASGNGGCSSTGCYVAVFLMLLYALVSAINQATLRDPDRLLSLESPGCYKRVVAKAWIAVATFCQPVFILDRTLAIIGTSDENIDVEERAEAIQRLYDSLAKLLQFIGQWLLLGGTVTLLVSTLELFALGVYTRTQAMTYLGLLLLCTCAVLIIILYLGITAHQMSTEDYNKKRKRQKLFVRFSFFCSPCVVLMAMICLTLSSYEYLQVPWISQMVGLDRHKLVQDYADGSLSDVEAVDTELSDSIVSTLRANACERANCSIPISAAMEEILYEMPTAAYTLIMLSVGLVMVIILTCRALGGGFFLASQVSGFTAILNFANGLIVAAFGFILYEDSINELGAPTNKQEAIDSLRAIEAKGEEAMVVQVLAIGALWMICVSLVGVVGHSQWCLPVAAGRKLVLRIYLILLIATFFAFKFIFMCFFYFASNAEELTLKYWNDPLFQQEKNRTTARDVTEQEFTRVVAASYNLAVVLTAVLAVYILLGVFATYYYLQAPKDWKDVAQARQEAVDVGTGSGNSTTEKHDTEAAEEGIDVEEGDNKDQKRKKKKGDKNSSKRSGTKGNDKESGGSVTFDNPINDQK